jgi:hypothetical protein
MSGIESCRHPSVFRPSLLLKAIGCAVFALGALVCGTAGVSAQNAAPPQRTYVDPFPKGDRYHVVVLGDSLGDGLSDGLYRAFEPDGNPEIVKRAKVSTGLVRVDYYDWNKALDDILKEDTYQIAVVMFGVNDDQAIRQGKEWLKPGTDAWREVYGQRVEALIKKLREAKVAVYWAGLPVMRSPDKSADAELLNDIYREKAFINGAKYVETWSGFTDESGRYSAYGPDMEGQVKRLRADDGVHFTPRGYLKLAHFVEKEIRHDLSVAKLERNIPLAGDAQEQAKMMGRVVGSDTKAVASAQPAGAPADAEAPPNVAETPAVPAQTVDAGQETAEDAESAGPKLQESQVGEVAVVRPVIPSATLEAVQNLTPSQSPGGSSSDNEMIASDLPGGLTALSSISSASDLSGSSKPKLPLTQRPYYKVLIQGEQLEPKAGRADDFTWPRS